MLFVHVMKTNIYKAKENSINSLVMILQQTNIDFLAELRGPSRSVPGQFYRILALLLTLI